MYETAALSYGPEAAAFHQTTGHILAQLRSVLYLESRAGQIIGLVGPDAPDGPLTVRVPDLAPLLRALAGQEDAPFQATGQGLEIAGTVLIPWDHAVPWSPTLPRALGPRPARVQATQMLAQLIPAYGPSEGCASLTGRLLDIMRSEHPQVRTDVGF